MSATATASPTATRPRLRADAVRNRERILAAAREALVAEGPEVPLDEIARRAGVGNATLYRHFPDRKSLLYHVLLFVTERFTERAESLLEGDLDPFEALSAALLGTSEERIGALCTLMLDSGIDPEDPELVASRERMSETAERLIERARESGQLRNDIGSGDVLLAIARLTRPMPGGECPGGEIAARRHLQIFIDGLRAPASSRLPGTPLDVDDLKDLKGEVHGGVRVR
ncbi:TetR/AcrR family transcriptional regulator [Streptomyces sp. 6N223]|uniref:TetR/AcrR family transcriptional regulator n=1 Tax=Streptomyces sp. 6N223 TaxID=3457412 RepID=UPI003FD0FB57